MVIFGIFKYYDDAQNSLKCHKFSRISLSKQSIHLSFQRIAHEIHDHKKMK